MLEVLDSHKDVLFRFFNSVLLVEEEARGCDHKCLLVDSKFRSKRWLLSLLAEPAHSVAEPAQCDFTSGVVACHSQKVLQRHGACSKDSRMFPKQLRRIFAPCFRESGTFSSLVDWEF